MSIYADMWMDGSRKAAKLQERNVDVPVLSRYSYKNVLLEHVVIIGVTIRTVS
jgi:hypothetical protein